MCNTCALVEPLVQVSVWLSLIPSSPLCSPHCCPSVSSSNCALIPHPLLKLQNTISAAPQAAVPFSTVSLSSHAEECALFQCAAGAWQTEWFQLLSTRLIRWIDTEKWNKVWVYTLCILSVMCCTYINNSHRYSYTLNGTAKSTFWNPRKIKQ